ncbi:MAG TPA: NAD(P)/FAD-dependent oxidoreductase [Thermomicrobiales bacterium]|nr:NAD(P)/FAD-dependent oxidoreductase [Thermomicrobiales bacterium]
MGAHEVIVVGAGPAGAVTGLLLARRGHGVLLLDKATFPRDKPCAEYLSPEINVLLARLGLRTAVEAARPARLRGFIIVPPGGRPFRGDFAPDGPRGYGLALPRTTLDALLVERARAAGVTVREGFRVGDLLREGGRVVGVRGRQRGRRDEEELRAPVTVGADGLHSVVAGRLGLARRPAARAPGPQVLALVTHLAGIARLGDYGEMHVAPGCYVGVAPLGGDLANVALVVPLAEGPAVAGRREEYFRAALGRFPLLAGRLDGARLAKPLLAVGPLAARARRYSAGGALLLGDAARFYDPFTGEGIYRALRGGELASEVIAAALAAGDVSARALARFDREYRAAFAGKYLVERVVHEIVTRPRLFDHVARRLARKAGLADRLVGVTGDYLPPRTVLTPGYLVRLFL